MPPVAMRAFKAALERGELGGAYVFHGDEDFLKEEKVAAVLASALDPATRDFNLDIFRGAETDAGALGAALDAMPMLAPRRVVIVRDAGALKKDAAAVMVRRAGSCPRDIVFLVVGSSSWKPPEPLLADAQSVEFKALTEDHAVAWVEQHAQEHGVVLAKHAATLLVSAIGTDLARAASELAKLREYAGPGRAVDAGAIAAIVGVRAGENASDLFDLVCAREGVKAAALVPVALAQPKTTAVSVVLALSAHILALGHCVARRSVGAAPRDLTGDVFAMMKQGRSAVVGRPWGEMVTCVVRNADRWDLHSVSHAVDRIAALDAALKESHLSSETALLTTAVLDICAGSGTDTSPRSRGGQVRAA